MWVINQLITGVRHPVESFKFITIVIGWKTVLSVWGCYQVLRLQQLDLQNILTGKGQQLDVFDTSMAIFGVFGVAKLNFQGVGRVM